MASESTAAVFGPATKSTNGTSTPSLTTYKTNSRYHINLDNDTFFNASTLSTISATFP